MLELHQKLKLVKISIGLIISHIVMGIFQERIMKQPYTDFEGKTSRFSLSFAYVAVQCFVNTFAALGTKLIHGHEKNETPQRYFAAISVFFVLAPVLSNMALKYVSYPTQVIGKASKPMVVMILGVAIGRKSYRPQKYISVLFIILGVIMFSFKTNYDEVNSEHLLYGNFFISMSLLMDGALGALQDRMRSVSKPTSINLMFFMNAWSSLYLLMPLIFTREGIDFINFCSTHPKIILDLSIVVSVGTIGHFFISQIISNFGALPLSLVMTVRKFLTVFLSVIIFKNELSILQWIATAIVFLALAGDSFFQGSLSTESCEVTISADDSENDNKCNKNLKSVIIDKNDIIGLFKANNTIDNEIPVECDVYVNKK